MVVNNSLFIARVLARPFRAFATLWDAYQGLHPDESGFRPWLIPRGPAGLTTNGNGRSNNR